VKNAALILKKASAAALFEGVTGNQPENCCSAYSSKSVNLTLLAMTAKSGQQSA